MKIKMIIHLKALLFVIKVSSADMFVFRYVVGANRVLFMLKDGAKAWEIKDFLVQQDRCELVTIESQDYPGKGGQSKVSSKWT